MKITFEVSFEELSDDTFKPSIELIESSSTEKFTGFIIEGSFPTKKEALKNACAHAESEARKRYGANIEINFEVKS